MSQQKSEESLFTQSYWEKCGLFKGRQIEAILGVPYPLLMVWASRNKISKVRHGRESFFVIREVIELLKSKGKTLVTEEDDEGVSL